MTQNRVKCTCHAYENILFSHFYYLTSTFFLFFFPNTESWSWGTWFGGKLQQIGLSVSFTKFTLRRWITLHVSCRLNFASLFAASCNNAGFFVSSFWFGTEIWDEMMTSVDKEWLQVHVRLSYIMKLLRMAHLPVPSFFFFWKENKATILSLVFVSGIVGRKIRTNKSEDLFLVSRQRWLFQEGSTWKEACCWRKNKSMFVLKYLY